MLEPLAGTGMLLRFIQNPEFETLKEKCRRRVADAGLDLTA